MIRARALLGRRPMRAVISRDVGAGSRLSAGLVALSVALAFFAVAVASVPARSEDGAKTPSILILNSWFPEQPWQAAVEKGIRDGLHEVGLQAQIYVEYLDAGRFSWKRVEDAHRGLFDAKFSSVPLDLVISESLAAGRFLALNPDLFPGAKRLYLRAGSVAPAGASRVDYNANVEQAFAEMLRVADPRHIFVVADTTGAIGKTRVGGAEAAVARLKPDAGGEYLVDLPLGYADGQRYRGRTPAVRRSGRADRGGAHQRHHAWRGAGIDRPDQHAVHL